MPPASFLFHWTEGGERDRERERERKREREKGERREEETHAQSFTWRTPCFASRAQSHVAFWRERERARARESERERE